MHLRSLEGEDILDPPGEKSPAGRTLSYLPILLGLAALRPLGAKLIINSKDNSVKFTPINARMMDAQVFADHPDRDRHWQARRAYKLPPSAYDVIGLDDLRCDPAHRWLIGYFYI